MATDSFSSANNIVAAVNEIGGATKLTEAEKARLNATLEKALEKYRVLGKDAPAGMQQLADDTRTVDKAQGGLLETVKNVALGLAAMFTVRAAVNFVNDVVQQASALKDLAQQTHINVEDLQLLAGAMSEFGVDADTLGKGLFTLSRKIAGGDESVSRALHTMGLSLKDVEGLEGQALFLKMEAGLATLHGIAARHHGVGSLRVAAGDGHGRGRRGHRRHARDAAPAEYRDDR